jgi:hypothetical protein
LIVIAISRMAPSTARPSGICPHFVIILLLNYHSSIQWSHSEVVPWLVLPAAWWLNLCPEIVATVRRTTLASSYNILQAENLQIGAIDLFPEDTGVVSPPIVYLSWVVLNICLI